MVFVGTRCWGTPLAGLLAANTSKMTTEACAYRTSPVFPRRDPGFPGAAQRFPRGVKAGGQRAFGLELRRRDNLPQQAQGNQEGRPRVSAHSSGSRGRQGGARKLERNHRESEVE